MANRMTIAKATEFYKETKGELNLCIISFERGESDPRRACAYGGYNCIDAFCQMANEAAKGRYAVLTDKRGWDYITERENETGRRVRLSEVQPYILNIDNDGHTWQNW